MNAPGYAGDLTPQQAWELLAQDPEAVLVDVRTHAEWAYVGGPDISSLGRSHLALEWQTYPDGRPNAAFVQQLRDRLGEGQRPVVMLCRSGVRSVAAAQAATAAGLGPAFNVLEGFEGGLDPAGHRGHEGWRAAGLPWRQG